MKFKAVCLGHSRFVVNESEKKKRNDKIALNGSILSTDIFSDFSMKTYVVGTHQRGASNEYHNVCFHGEIRKILYGYPSY